MPRDGELSELGRVEKATKICLTLDPFSLMRSSWHHVCLESGQRYPEQALIGFRFVPVRCAVALAGELGLFSWCESINTHFKPTGVWREGVTVTYYCVGRNGILIPTQTFRMNERQLILRLGLCQ